MSLNVELFWPKVQITPACWEWTAYRVPAGYGRFAVRGRMTPAHRVSWQLHHGPIPDGLLVRHRCDNPPCVNPDHLELGTDADNARDRKERGRHHRTILSDAQVAEIRDRYVPVVFRGPGWVRSNAADLAVEYGVSKSNILNIARGTRRAA